MQKNILYTLSYGILVFLGGIMAFFHGNETISFFFEIIGGFAFFICSYLLSKKKRAVYYITLALACILLIFYGVSFGKMYGFYPAIMAILTAFLIISFVKEIYKLFYSSSK